MVVSGKGSCNDNVIISNLCYDPYPLIYQHEDSADQTPSYRIKDKVQLVPVVTRAINLVLYSNISVSFATRYAQFTVQGTGR